MAELKAPMPGKVVEIIVKIGDTVETGETAIVIESMKMEVPIVANHAGTVKEIFCNVEDSVDKNTTLLIIE